MRLPDDLDALRRAVEAGMVFRYRLFYGHAASADGALSDSVFSQFWPCRLTVDGQSYTSAEQFMMAGKARLFGDRESLAAILATHEPPACKALGRKVRGFDEARWAEARFELVTRGNVAKFGQDDGLRRHLLATDGEILVEASPRDTIWGIGLGKANPLAEDPRRWRGTNLLGFALVRAREIISAASLP
jgi:ribA/ribD-fused uncharacterized protein